MLGLWDDRCPRERPWSGPTDNLLGSAAPSGLLASEPTAFRVHGTSEFVAGPIGGTDGPITGTVTALTKENYRLRSDEKDRDAPIDTSSGPTTGAHIIYQMGVGLW